MRGFPQLKYQWLRRFFNTRLLILYFLSLGAYIALGYFTPRQDFPQLIALYSSLFVLFGMAYNMVRTGPEVVLTLYASLLFRFALLFCLPALSDDFYRFFWDGWLMTENLNPFTYLPSDIVTRNPGLLTEEARRAFDSMNSTDYYSVYPPVTQYIFWLAALISPNSLWGSVVVMKSIIFLVEAGTLFFMMRLAWYFRLPRKTILLYALNPLVIIELTGNLHFEALMIFFLMMASYLILRRLYLSSAVAFALAIGAKLWPLMFIPFLIKRLYWDKFLQFGLVVSITLIVVFIPFYTPTFLPNFFSSLSLYFQHFEFNGSIYYLVRWAMNEFYGYNLIEVIGRVLAGVTALGIVMMAIVDRRYSIQSFLRLSLLALSLYLLLSTTVHPWYIVPLIAFGVFTEFRFPIVWAVLIPFTYITYQTIPYDENLWVVGIEYAFVISAFVGDSFKLERWWQKLTKWWINLRAGLKVNRLKGWLSLDEQVLDIGTGNGGVAYKLYKRGVDVTTIDIKNRSSITLIQPVIYDGDHIPFSDDAFQTVMLLTVLHHAHEPETILREGKRVGSRLIVMEDIYSNKLQQKLTYWMDSLVNLEFRGHPHTNKTDQEWRALFQKLGLQITKVRYDRVLGIFRQVTYELKRV